MSDVKTGLLDTNTLILLPRLRDATVLPDQPLISTITLAELSVGPLVAADESERAARLAHLQQAEADFDPLPFDVEAARAFGQVAASLRRSGRKANARAYDAMIAAVALANGLPLYTCNPDDFAGIDGLVIVAVTHPDREPAAGCPGESLVPSARWGLERETGLEPATFSLEGRSGYTLWHSSWEAEHFVSSYRVFVGLRRRGQLPNLIAQGLHDAGLRLG